MSNVCGEKSPVKGVREMCVERELDEWLAVTVCVSSSPIQRAAAFGPTSSSCSISWRAYRGHRYTATILTPPGSSTAFPQDTSQLIRLSAPGLSSYPASLPPSLLLPFPVFSSSHTPGLLYTFFAKKDSAITVLHIRSSVLSTPKVAASEGRRARLFKNSQIEK
ncbi:hypothetical protein E2C01_043278 [Portunus trituberculatus]|uniref:Uncharacterized protein n=1 Tax=Portunus trituberculatus TaxID=210409 RepID=A0A5B7FVA7_PORTR|nr:hypothetical protein [Portunus trituberculatus]